MYIRNCAYEHKMTHLYAWHQIFTYIHIYVPVLTDACEVLWASRSVVCTFKPLRLLYFPCDTATYILVYCYFLLHCG